MKTIPYKGTEEGSVVWYYVLAGAVAVMFLLAEFLPHCPAPPFPKGCGPCVSWCSSLCDPDAYSYEWLSSVQVCHYGCHAWGRIDDKFLGDSSKYLKTDPLAYYENDLTELNAWLEENYELHRGVPKGTQLTE